MYVFKRTSTIVMFVHRNYWLVVRKVREKLKMVWRSCLVCPRELMMPCTSACWRVSNTHIHKHSLLNQTQTLILTTYSLPHFLPGFDENIESQGELILQESFQVWDPKTLIRKGRERHLFLFEMSLIFSKDVKDSNGRSKYLYKSKLMVWVSFHFIISYLTEKSLLE